MGGIGKTTLVTALAHDQEVLTHFDNGILWATLGQQPNLLSLLSGWVQALGDYDFKATSEVDASNRLRTLLYNKVVLLVIDDAWDSKHIEAFKVGGQNCKVIITTRRPDIALEVGAELYQLDLMTEEQSLALFARVLGRELEEKETEEAKLLAASVGYLPYALNLAAKIIKKPGTSWKELLDALNAEVARLEKLETTTRKRRKGEISLEALFNKSLEALQEDEPDLGENFNWLGILPEDVSIAAPMLTTLWEVEVEEADERLELLRNESLLLPGSPVIIKDKRWNTYRVHDILHDIACRRLCKKQAQKDSLAESHAAFIKRYQTKTQNEKWHSLENDGYIHSYLTWHLEKAGLVNEIHSLLREESETGCNGWYEACDRLGQTANFVTDVARAWQLVEDSWTETTLPEVIGLQCRYALMQASINSIKENIPATLLEALVREGMWTVTKGLAYAKQNPETLAALVRSLRQGSLEEGQLQNIRQEFNNEFHKALVLCALVHHDKNWQQEALKAVKDVKDPPKRIKALDALPRELPEDLRKEAWKWAKEIDRIANSKDYQLQALRKLGIKWEEFLPDVMEETLAINHKEEKFRITNIYRLVILLSKDKYKHKYLREKIVREAKKIKKIDYQVYILSALASDLSCTELTKVLDEVISKESDKYNVNENFRAEALAWIADYLYKEPSAPQCLLKIIENEVKNIENGLVKALSVLSPNIPQYDLLDVLDNCYEVEIQEMLDIVLERLVPSLLLSNLSIKDIMEKISNIPGEKIKDQISNAVFLQASKEQLSEILRAKQQIKDKDAQVLTLCKLSQYKLPQNLLLQILDATELIDFEYDKASVIVELSPYLTEEYLQKKAFEVVETIRNKDDKTYALSGLFQHLPEDKKSDVMNKVEMINKDHDSDLVLIQLLSSLPRREQRLEKVNEIKNECYYHLALRKLLPLLPLEQLPEALEIVEKLNEDEEKWKAISLGVLYPYLSTDLLREEALNIAQGIKNENSKTLAFCGLYPYLSEDMKSKVRNSVKETQYCDWKDKIIAIYPYLPKNDLYDLFCKRLSVVATHERKKLLADIGELSPVVFHLGGTEAIEQIFNTIQKVGRQWR